MPPRPPPSPPILTVLCCLLAGGSAYGLSLAEAGLRERLVALSPVGWGLAVVGLSLAVLLLTGMLYWITSMFRLAGWLRAVVLVGSVVGLVWVPTALVVAVLPDGSGPFAAVYARLGDPQAGRWAAAGLGVVAWVILAGLAIGRSIGTGRSWMRVDGLEFRRRLVRVVSGWPSAVAVGTLATAAGWARTPLVLLWIAAVVAVLQLRTR